VRREKDLGCRTSSAPPGVVRGVVTSSEARPTVPSSSARRSASWSTKEPRAMFTRWSPGRTSANVSALTTWRVSSGGRRRQHQVMGRREQIVERGGHGHALNGTGQIARRMATTDMSMASAMRATRCAIPPNPKRPRVAPANRPACWTNSSRAFPKPVGRKSRTNASHRRDHVFADGRAAQPRAEVSTRAAAPRVEPRRGLSRSAVPIAHPPPWPAPNWVPPAEQHLAVRAPRHAS